MDKKKKSPRKSPRAPKIRDLDVQQRKLAIIKQKKCDAVALHIVRKLIDSPVEEDVFIQSLKYLNQCHYQDIVEERAITKLCGYPICGNSIKEVPAKKFHISTKRNKVYDITERKNYCSNFCYKAGVHIKEQMLSSPLWFRDKEEIPEFHLLPKTEPGVPGQEIDQGILKVDVDEESFTSISEFAQDMMNKIPEDIQINAEQKTEIAQQKEDLKKEGSKEVSESQNQYFSKFFTPSLADILKENATYFTTESSSDSKTATNKADNKLELNNKSILKGKENNSINKKIETNLVSIKSNEPSHKLVEPSNKINETPKPSENYKIGFNRTVINTKTNEEQKTKGILKNTKIKTQKKRVSFSSENSVQELEQLPIIESTENKTFKKPETNKSDENKNPRFKNTNVIGVVQERSTIFVKNSDKERSTITVNNPDRETSTFVNNPDRETSTFVNKSDNFNELKNSDNNLKNEANKEARLSRLKNSSTFKKVHRIPNPVSHQPNTSNTSKFSSTNLTSRLETSLSEWFTFETALFLYGEEHVKKIISEKSFKHYLNKKKNMELDENKQKQYEEICKRLKLMELADQKFDETVTGRKRRPLPRYEDLREATEHQDLRVQAFYSGCYEIDLEEDDTDTESVKDEEAEDNEDRSSVEQGTPAVLPLVDNKDVMATRRKIFLTCISRAIPIICEILEESPNTLLAEIKHLINTFDFSASNIVFKSAEWQLVTVLLIQILSVRDKDLRTSLERKEVCLFLSSLAKQFGLPDKYIKDVLSKVKVQSLLDECMRKDCIEY